MATVTQNDTSPQTGMKLTSPISPKRQRIDYTVTNDGSVKSGFDFPEPLTFQKTISSPSSTSTLQKNEGHICSAEHGGFRDANPHDQPQDTKLNVTPITEVTTSQSDNAHAASANEGFVTAERHLLFLGEDEQLSDTETDSFSLYPGDDTGGLFASASTDTPCCPDGKQLRKSLENETPGGCNLSSGNNRDGRQVHHDVSQNQAVTVSKSDCTLKNDDTGFCNPRSQFSEVAETNQRRNELEYCENILSEEKDKSPTSSSNYADSKPLYSNPAEDPSGNLAEGGKNAKNELELQICKKENISVCDWETKGRVNEKGSSATFISFAAESAEGSILAYDVVSDRTSAMENVCFEVDDFCRAKAEHAAGEIIAKAQSEMADHTTETPMPPRISQEPAEGDNDAGPFGVIDPAIWSETDREAEEKHSNSESTAGVDLSPLVNGHEMEAQLPLCSDVRPSHKVSSPDQTGQFNHQSGTGQDENEDFYQACKELQGCSIITNKMHKIGKEGNCQWKSSPSSSPGKSLPADNDEESHNGVGHELRQQNQSSCFPVSLDHLETQEAEYSQSDIYRNDRTAEIKEGREITGFVEEMDSNEDRSLEKTVMSEEELQHKNDTTEISSGDRTEPKTHATDSKLKLVEGKQENKLCLSDPEFSMMDVTTEEKEKDEEVNAGKEMRTDGNENSKLLAKCEDVQQENEHKAHVAEMSLGESVSEWTEGNNLTLYSKDDEDCDRLALIFSSSDAVVPCQHDLSHSQKAQHSPPVLNCSDRFFILPSASTRVLGGLDTFEKIQLPPDDDDDDAVPAGLGNIHVLTSSPRQLLETPQRQLRHCMPAAEGDELKEIPEGEEEGKEQEGERFECHTENTTNGFVSSDSVCDEVLNFISAADVIALRWPEQQFNCESASDSSDHIQDEMKPQSESAAISTVSDSAASDVNNCCEFEMKKQFNMVLKELNLFFDISRTDFVKECSPSSPEWCSDLTEPLEGNTYKEHLSSPEVGHRDTSSDDADKDRSLKMCGSDPLLSCTAVSSDSEQEVPLSTNLCQEASLNPAGTHREYQKMEQNGKMCSPSFMCLPLLEQLIHRPPEPPRRLEPLKTCTRPIRVGLSKRAKTKHLHRPHPYK